MEEAERFLETLYPLYGEMVEVTKLPEGDHTVIDPIAEFKMQHPGARIIKLG